jgi:hypothetical protein
MSNGRFYRMRLTFQQGDSLFVHPCHEMAAVACRKCNWSTDTPETARNPRLHETASSPWTRLFATSWPCGATDWECSESIFSILLADESRILVRFPCLNVKRSVSARRRYRQFPAFDRRQFVATASERTSLGLERQSLAVFMQAHAVICSILSHCLRCSRK